MVVAQWLSHKDCLVIYLSTDVKHYVKASLARLVDMYAFSTSTQRVAAF